MPSSYITANLDEGNEVLINPLIDPSALLEKTNRRIVYNPRVKKYQEVVSRIYVFPVYLPELGILLSLEMTSKELAEKFYQETKDYEGMVSRGKVFCCRLHNFQKNMNRMVSWGTIRSSCLADTLLKLYVTNLVNDFYMTPSVVKKEYIFSPHRWFFISSSSYSRFEAFLNYNFGIIYIEKEENLHRKIKKIWINSPFRLYESRGTFISFYPDGFVSAKSVPVHFSEDPVEIDVFLNNGDYFICFLISFNNYSTSYEEADIKKGNINLVETIVELVNSPYEILPFLFPFMVRPEDLKKLVYCFSVSREIFEKISSRLAKFGKPQNPEFVSCYEKIVRETNRLLNIVEKDKFYLVEVANPILIPFLLKKLAFTEVTTVRRYVEALFAEVEILEKIKHMDELLKKNQVLPSEFLPLYGIGRYLTPRADILTNYIHIFRGH